MGQKLKAFYHITWVDAKECQLYIDDMQLPWYQERFVLRYHLINGIHHTFIIRRRGVGKGIREVGVEALRHAL